MNRPELPWFWLITTVPLPVGGMTAAPVTFNDPSALTSMPYCVFAVNCVGVPLGTLMFTTPPETFRPLRTTPVTPAFFTTTPAPMFRVAAVTLMLCARVLWRVRSERPTVRVPLTGTAKPDVLPLPSRISGPAGSPATPEPVFVRLKPEVLFGFAWLVAAGRTIVIGPPVVVTVTFGCTVSGRTSLAA